MRSTVRWLVPVAVAATLAGGIAVSSAQAGNAPDLPASTPEKVLEAVAASKVTALSGTVVTRADVGLPALDLLGQSAGAADAANPAGLLTRFLAGKNTVRVWLDGPTRQRAQLLDPFSELDVVRNGTQVWTYTSHGNAVQHGTVPEHARASATGSASPPAPATLTPAELAQRAIAAAGPTTAVTLGEPQLVASRTAYTVTLTPKSTATLVGKVEIAVDAERGVPLRVEVFARGAATPAIETGFTSVDFTTPAAERFAFTPPPGASVSDLSSRTASGATGSTPSMPAAAKPTVTGTGWASIVEVPAAAVQGLTSRRAGSATGTDGARQTGAAPGLSALEQLTTPTPAGRGLTTSLVSVLFTTDGRVLAGAVPLSALVAAAGQ